MVVDCTMTVSASESLPAMKRALRGVPREPNNLTLSTTDGGVRMVTSA